MPMCLITSYWFRPKSVEEYKIPNKKGKARPTFTFLLGILQSLTFWAGPVKKYPLLSMWFTITTCTQPWWAVQGVCFQFGASFSNQTNVNFLANLLLLHEADRNLTKFQPSPLPPSNQIDSPKFCRVFALEKTFLLPLLGKLILGSCIILLATNFEIFTENEICFQLILKIQILKAYSCSERFPSVWNWWLYVEGNAGEVLLESRRRDDLRNSSNNPTSPLF